ncbi:hypothetical protein BOX15_Mlig008822g1 [Macrostomum lignano]|uniref:Uncharacterized protein n=1 Tax=Macrostomum lignano TaxID=282301 RepID=A0A267G5P6_9PLAT|nr:hypothetical protein BOX15_Mlig008822g1 [Macrostomum lignano]
MPEFTSDPALQSHVSYTAQPLSRREASRLGDGLRLGGSAAAAAVRELLQLLPASSLAECRGDNGWTPLHYCALGGDASADAAAELLAAGADPDVFDDSGWTPLHQSADKNSLRVAAELLSHPSCQPDRRSAEGRTPMSLAAESWRGSIRIVRLLLTAGSTAEAAAEAAKVAELTAAALPSSCGKSGMARLLRAAARSWKPAEDSTQARVARISPRKRAPTAPLRSPFGCGCRGETNCTTGSSAQNK